MDLGLTLVRRICPCCGAKIALYVRKADYELWQNGASVQYAFRSPMYTPGDREFFISGMCEDCQRDVFGG